jgi:hypothetical protein
MNNHNFYLMALCMLVIGVTAGAQDIYKRVNADGVVEFRDRPFAGSSQVEVRPNVVATNPVKRRERPASTVEQPPPTTAPVPSSQARSAEQTRYAYAAARGTRERRIQARREQRERRSYREEDATDPNPGRAIRSAVRNASLPAPR